MERILGYVQAGQRKAPSWFAAESVLRRSGQGLLRQPTVFDGVKNNMKIAQEEIFGPVLSVIPFNTMEEVSERPTRPSFGLSAGVWTRDIKKAHRLAAHIKAGTIWINCFNVFDPRVPFGGYKMSGYGRELGKHSIELYTNIKSVWVNIAE